MGDLSEKEVQEFIASSKGASTFSRKPPPQWLLDDYYECWRRGLTDEAIYNSAYRLCLLERQLFDTYKPHFYTYVREKNSEAMKKNVCVMQKTKDIENELVLAISCGATKETAARMSNIPIPTLLYWMEEDPIFRNALLFATETANAKVQQALFSRATGTKQVLRSKTITRQKAGPESPPELVHDGYIVMESATEREEYTPASVEAIKFWLANRDARQFSLSGGGSDTNQKSAILEAISRMSEVTEAELTELGEE